MVHDIYNEMLAAHALGTLAENEARALEKHLATCTECPPELEGWQITVAALALAAPLAEPSPQVRTRILESLRAEPSGAASTIEISERHRKPTVIPLRQKRSWNWAQNFAAIAAAVAFVALIISIVVLWKQNRTAQGQIAALNTERIAVQQELDRQRKVLELLSAPGAKVAVLSGTAQAPNAHATNAQNATIRTADVFISSSS